MWVGFLVPFVSHSHHFPLLSSTSLIVWLGCPSFLTFILTIRRAQRPRVWGGRSLPYGRRVRLWDGGETRVRHSGETELWEGRNVRRESDRDAEGTDRMRERSGSSVTLSPSTRSSFSRFVPSLRSVSHLVQSSEWNEWNEWREGGMIRGERPCRERNTSGGTERGLSDRPFPSSSLLITSRYGPFSSFSSRTVPWPKGADREGKRDRNVRRMEEEIIGNRWKELDYDGYYLVSAVYILVSLYGIS